MAVDFLITTLDTEKELRQLRNFIYSRHLWYPDYEAWVDGTCIPEIETGWKNAILAYSNNFLVGNIVYQPHKQLPRTRELKNLRIEPAFRRRDLAHFLVRQVEEEDKESFDRIIVDADSKAQDVTRLFRFCGFKVLFEAPLYCSKNIDVIMGKEYKRNLFN